VGCATILGIGAVIAVCAGIGSYLDSLIPAAPPDSSGTGNVNAVTEQPDTTKSVSDAIPSDVRFEILEEDTLGNIKRMLTVTLSRKVQPEALRSIAKKLKDNAKTNYERTFIEYYLPSDDVQGSAWATSHFNPDLQVSILGPTIEESEAAANDPDWPTSPTKYDSAREAILAMHDYSEENNTFDVRSRNPPHIRISAQVVENDLREVIIEENKRALLYGVYRTFIHTDAQKVTVSAIPVQMSFDDDETQLLHRFGRTITITRQQSLEVARHWLDVESFSDLVETKNFDGEPMTDMWTDKFKRGYYNDSPPGLDRFYQAVIRTVTEN
jgi:hypothetical protein